MTFIYFRPKKTKTTKQKCLQLYYVNSYKHPLNKKQHKYKIKVPESRKKNVYFKIKFEKVNHLLHVVHVNLITRVDLIVE